MSTNPTPSPSELDHTAAAQAAHDALDFEREGNYQLANVAAAVSVAHSLTVISGALARIVELLEEEVPQ